MPVVPHRLDTENTRPAWWRRQAAIPAPFQTPIPAVPADDPPGPVPVPSSAQTTTSSKAATAAPIASTSTSKATTPTSTSRATTTPTSILPARPTVITSSTKIASLPTTTGTSQISSTPNKPSASPSSEAGPHSYIYFPVHTAKETHRVSSGRGYAFLKNNELADSMLIFAAFLVVSLIASIILIKATQIRSRRQGSKVDQMVGEDMKWQERREVLERKIIWEGSGAAGGRKLKSAPGKSKMGPGYRGVGEAERRR